MSPALSIHARHGLFCLALFIGAARGDMISQELFNFGNTIRSDIVTGQSFVADDSYLDEISLMVTNYSVSNPFDLAITVLQGDGMEGATIATSGPVSVPAGYSSSTDPDRWFDVGFNGTPLTVGEVYTFTVSTTASYSAGIILSRYNNPFDNGQMHYMREGIYNPWYNLHDMTFRINASTTSVPEPATATLLAMGMMIFGIGAFRRKWK